MEKVTGVETHVLLSLNKYKHLTSLSTRNEDMSKKCVQEVASQTEDMHQQMHNFIELVLRCVPVQREKSCMLILQHLAQLCGACAFDPRNGEIILDQQLSLHETNICEVVRILLSSPRTNAVRTAKDEEECGVRVIADIIARFTLLPASIITHPYWLAYITFCRANFKDVTCSSDSSSDDLLQNCMLDSLTVLLYFHHHKLSLTCYIICTVTARTVMRMRKVITYFIQSLRPSHT